MHESLLIPPFMLGGRGNITAEAQCTHWQTVSFLKAAS